MACRGQFTCLVTAPPIFNTETFPQEVSEPHLGPLTGPLLGPDGAPLLGIQRSDEGADGGATHDVDGDPGLLHGLDDAHVGAAPAPGEPAAATQSGTVAGER